MPAVALPSLQQRLTDAQIALHNLNIGKMAVEVEVAGGMRVTFTPAQIDKLEAYVKDLQAQIAGVRTVGAIGFVF
jgi:hypothetical protein